MRNPIIVALDLPNAEAALALARELASLAGAFKIGSELFTAAGPDIVRKVRDLGAEVFLDLKFHDIPNTVAKAVAAATRLDIQMLTIHCSGGREMMQAAEEAAQKTAAESRRTPPLVLGVTVLTSMDDPALELIGVPSNAGAQVEKLSRLAVQAGLRGLVCSPLEVEPLRRFLPAAIQLVTPGIRMERARGDDQKRTLGPAEALNAGANWLVVGRPIYAAPNPKTALQQILHTLES